MSTRKPMAGCLTINQILTQRQLGLKPSFGYSDKLAKKMYSSLEAFEGYHFPLYNGFEGGIFNLEFSMDGHTLVAACENSSIAMYDSLNENCYKCLEHAHDGCVNGIEFFDDYMFASCSDDQTVRIWDRRRFEVPIHVLRGHTNWVKNIEYIKSKQILVSSGFDGHIVSWNINNLSSSTDYNKLYIMNDLMRTKVTKDGTKMLISSTNGYMMIIHDLNLETLQKDIRFFKPNLYKYLQSDEKRNADVTAFTYLLSQERKKNRIELIDDFPNEPSVISSVQIHPMGWCCLSRNINDEENDEWTAVHDIQTRPASDYDHAYRITNRANETDIDRWLCLIEFDQNTFLQTEDYKTHLKYKHTTLLNIPRLTNYVQEKDTGKGFIKEQCFSPDGRIICSPYGKGVRLLSFNEDVQELPYCISNVPTPLLTLTELVDYHNDYVVSCRFNPLIHQLVSGCLNGDIVWHRPMF